jgi:CHAT domain-containing protein/tetratricopeptide (TPR) repeat protein
MYRISLIAAVHTCLLLGSASSTEDVENGARLRDIQTAIEESDSPLARMRLADEAFDLSKEVYGSTDERTIGAAQQLIDSMWDANRRDAAIALSLIVLDWETALHGRVSPQVADRLRVAGNLTRSQKRNKESEQLYLEAISIVRQLEGDNTAGMVALFRNLGALYQQWGRHDQADSTFATALKTIEAIGSNADIADMHTRIAQFRNATGELELAVDAFSHAIERWKLVDTPDAVERLADTELQLASVLHQTADYPSAEAAIRSAIAKLITRFGPDGADVASARGHLAETLAAAGRPREAIMELEDVREIYDQTYGPTHPYSLNVATRIAQFLSQDGRYDEAAKLVMDVIRAFTETGVDSAWIDNAQEILADIELARGDPLAAAALYELSLTSGEQSGKLVGLARTHLDRGDPARAERLLQRALDRLADSSPNSATRAEVLTAMASSKLALDRPEDAKAAMLEAVEIYSALGPEFEAARLISSIELADIERALGDHASASEAYRYLLSRLRENPEVYWQEIASLLTRIGWLELTREKPDLDLAWTSLREMQQIYEKAGLASHPDLINPKMSMALIRVQYRDWLAAADIAKQAVDLVLQQRSVSISTSEAHSHQRDRDSSNSNSEIISFYLQVARKLWEESPELRPAVVSDTFRIGQTAFTSSASLALQDASARTARPDDPVRRMQDLVRRRHDAREDFSALYESGNADRKPSEVQPILDRIRGLEEEIAELQQSVADDPSDPSTNHRINGMSVDEVQSYLGEEDALLLYADVEYAASPAPAHTHLWVVTKDAAEWFSLPLDPKELAGRISQIRSTLGIQAPTRGATALQEKADGTSPIEMLHDLYLNTVWGVHTLIEGKTLLIVPSRSLSALPFQMLVTELPQSGGNDVSDEWKDVSWLIRENAIAVLPSVAALADRRATRDTSAKPSYLGIGNPLLVGRNGEDRRAFDIEGCSDALSIYASAYQTRAVDPDVPADASLQRTLQRLDPLPESAYELCKIAQSTDTQRTEVLLGESATEGQIAQMNGDGRLFGVDIMQFATHGLTGGELEGVSEPSLVLTPPDQGLAADDGLLSMTEILNFRLNADWVILSACNTGSSANAGEEAYSGLASAFLYAGARSVFVTHWAVVSDAAVEITVRTLDAYFTAGAVGKAEAHQSAILSLVAEGGVKADPRYWAPFVLVGDYR